MKTTAISLAVGFCLTAAMAPGAIVIGGTIGNGDFEATEVPGDPDAVTGAQTYEQTPHWFNASGAETINFTQDTQTGGSSQPNSRAGMPFHNRTQVNDTGYTITAAGDLFSLSYDFGAGGPPANWDGDEVMHTFLFTATVPVDGDLTTADMTILGGDDYPINRAADGQWTKREVPMFYTATADDVGKTVYFGMVFDQGGGPTLFPRIDVIQLEVTPIPEPTALSLLALVAAGLMLRRWTAKP